MAPSDSRTRQPSRPDAHGEFLDAAVLARLSRLTLGARLPMIGSVSGLHKSATRGSSVEFAEYRKYVPGDDVKHVDWRVYARTDRFYMKEFEAETNLRCHLAVDTSASMGFEAAHGTKLALARRMAATLAYLLALQGDAVGLRCFAESTVQDIPPRRNPSHLRIVLDALAAMQPAGKTDLPASLHDLAESVRRRALVIVFSDLLTPPAALLDGFQHMRFRKHDLAVFHFVDPQELAFDFDRPVRFLDCESDFRLLTDPAVVRAGYQEALHRHLEAIRTGCNEFKVDYQLVSTDADYEKVLARFLIARTGGRTGA